MRDSDTDKTDATTIEIRRRLEVGSDKTKRPMEEVDQEVVEPIQEGTLIESIIVQSVRTAENKGEGIVVTD